MNYKIGIIGLGYVGLPLAVEFSKYYDVVGFDINENRINDLKKGIDKTEECSVNILKDAAINYTSIESELLDCNIFIVTVPTPIGRYNEPDLTFLKLASELVGRNLRKNDLVIYESTVFPGCTEEDCVPILEKTSSLVFNQGFFCGYSPERINPGDKVNTLPKIIKVVSGSNEYSTKIVAEIYSKIITAGIHVARSIKVAEASKAIENAQRDLNISFFNELAIIFDKMNIDTQDVIEAASTKWNFLKYSPGLVGGHCIGVDPFYLAKKSESLGYTPEVILSGRKVNEYIPKFIAEKVIKLLVNSKIDLKNASILILGITFKENCPDIRNSKVIEVINSLKEYGINLYINDPVADSDNVYDEFGIQLINDIYINKYDGIILAVPHDSFNTVNYESLKKSSSSIIYDVKSKLDRNLITDRL
jgi:UDP-N-acetyl-D-galactosamine dehydrogenase